MRSLLQQVVRRGYEANLVGSPAGAKRTRDCVSAAETSCLLIHSLHDFVLEACPRPIVAPDPKRNLLTSFPMHPSSTTLLRDVSSQTTRANAGSAGASLDCFHEPKRVCCTLRSDKTSGKRENCSEAYGKRLSKTPSNAESPVCSRNR